MKTLIDNATLARLVAIAADLAKLYENGWIRDTGETVFKGVRAELADIVATATEPVTAAPVNTIVAMPLNQVEALVDAVVSRVELAAAAGAELSAQTIRTELEDSEVAVLDALASTRADVLAAIAPANSAATTA